MIFNSTQHLALLDVNVACKSIHVLKYIYAFRSRGKGTWEHLVNDQLNDGLVPEDNLFTVSTHVAPLWLGTHQNMHQRMQ